MLKKAAERLRALADFIEVEGVSISRLDAAGDSQNVVLILKMKAGGDEIVEMINRKLLTPVQRRFPLDTDAQSDLPLCEC